MLGGSLPGFPLPIEVAEKSYLGVLKALGAEGASPEGRIEALLRAPPEILLGQLGKTAQFMPAMDGDTVPYVPTFELAASKKMVPQNASCKAAMVGYAPLDVSCSADTLLVKKVSKWLHVSHRAIFSP